MYKRILSYVCIVFIFISSIIITSAETNEHTVGMIWNTQEELAPYLDSEGILDQIFLPDSFDNTSKFPSPGDQGKQACCTAWAVGYALKAAQEYNKRNWSISTTNHHFSPSFIFNELNGGTNSGISILDTMEFVKENGVCPMTYFPYDENHFDNGATNLQYAAADLYEITRFGVTDTIRKIKQRIVNNLGVVIGIQVYPDFDNISSSNDTFDIIRNNENSRGAHAICLIGYDDSKNAFKFINSWGTNWGVNGYGWISYDMVKNESVNIHGEAYGFYMTVKSSDNYIMGDINEDGTVNAVDGRLALRFSSDVQTPTSRQFVLADVDGNATVNAADSRYILRYSSGIESLPLYN